MDGPEWRMAKEPLHDLLGSRALMTCGEAPDARIRVGRFRQ